MKAIKTFGHAALMALMAMACAGDGGKHRAVHGRQQPVHRE